MSSPENKAAEMAEDAIDVAAEMAKENAVRLLNRTKLQFALGGWVLGAITGGFFAYKFAYSRAQTKYSQIVDDEIAEMREHYREKGRALESEAAKGDLDLLVNDLGYSESEDEKPPMVIQPPRAETKSEDKPPEPPKTRNIFAEPPPVNHEWDWHAERRGRSPDTPYVIHYDERYELEYEETTLTYYTVDDVLCNNDDEVYDHDARNALIGEGSLDRFGHGSNDPSIVYVRNDKLELVFEVVKSPNCYAEEVHGFQHYIDSYKNLESMRNRERDDQEE